MLAGSLLPARGEPRSGAATTADGAVPDILLKGIEHAAVSDERPLFDGENQVDVQVDGSSFQPGDLVEVW